MDYFFTRHSYPCLAIDDDILFLGNVTDSNGTPHYIELQIPKKRDYLSVLIQTSFGEFFNLVTSNFDFVALPLKEQPYYPNTKDFAERINNIKSSTRYRCIDIIASTFHGQVFLHLDLSKLTIDFNNNPNINSKN